MKKRYTVFTSNFISMFFSISCAFLSFSTCLGAAYNVNALTDTGAGAGLNGDLRYCINQANALAGAHTITFSTSGTINLTSTLPTFTKQISVTATIGNIVINGGGTVNWVFFFNNAGAAGSVLDGLVINRAGANFPNIELNGVNNITIQNCYIGTDATGNAAAASSNFFGIYFVTATSNFILNNVISGHTQHGMALVSASNGNTIRGNKIGCNRLATAAIPNSFSGIEINGSINNIIGGALAANRNIISGNTLSGVSLVNVSTGTQITNNYIGTNLAGTAALGNKEHGIKIDASANTTVTNNVICASGNTAPVVFGFGLHIINSNGHVIRGNNVGINAAGTTAIANNYIGLRIENCDNVVIGGATAGQGNTLSGNGEEGILMINCAAPSIKGNFIGTNSTGAAAVANGRSGLHIQGSATPVIGGTAAGESNTISGNAWDGIQLETATNATIQGNFIGTNSTGTAAIGNGSNGISGYTNSTGNLIGGTTVAARNIISCNGVDGIHYDGITIACNNLLIKNNYIGTNASGTGAAATFGNGKSGVVVLNNCLGLIIGGTTAAERNIISGNGRLWGGVGNGTGIVINGGCTSAQIINNYIGLAVDGTTAMGNSENGIVVVYTNNVTIGGNNSTLRNLVSSNGKQGIVLSADPGTPITGSLIIGNYIGTDITGTLVRGNGQSGIISIFGNNGFFGRANANEGNLISNNAEEGIHFVGGSGNTVYNNLIGVAANGTTAMGNKSGGVFIQGVGGGTNGSTNIVGGLAALQPNTIAYTTGTGVNPDLGNGFGIGVAHNDQGINNTFIGNKIFCNAGLGIDLDFAGAFGGAGVNNPGNGGKTAPAITAVTTTSTTGSGTNGETIHVYSNVTCTTCQGETYLGSAVVAGGVWTVTHVAVAAPFNNSATATNATQGTSQFACNFVLPVELISFHAKAQGDAALLTWSTAMEKNNAAFVIERSKDGKTFEAIGNKAGQGSTLQTTHYDFTDEQPYRGVTYYRLKQIDFDGTQTYTAIQAVYFESAGDIYLFPNPATDELNVVLSSDETYDIHVYSNLGVEVQHLSTTKNNNTYTIRLNGVASGSYIIELSSASKQITKQFLVY
ncbi:MAG: hypothetical protein JWM14_225 [Chitinophagaceae bacterium]|nr:hypothetical protein [Chitinophagaceae bacterium]